MASESDDGLREPEQPDRAPAHPASPHQPSARRGRRSQLTVALVTGAVLVAGGGAYWAASAADHPHNGAASHGGPPPLAIDTATVNGGMLPGTTVGAGLKVTGQLPPGPASAPVYRVDGQASRDRVAKLAAALRVPGPVLSLAGVWKAAPSGGGPGPTLQVGKEAQNSWAYALDGAGSACKAPRPPNGGVAGHHVCYGATSGAGAVSPAAAERAAAPVLTALGLTDSQVDASQTVGNIRTVTVDPVVGGMPTHGWQTTLQIGPDGRVATADGRLAPLTRGASYPVVSARHALDDLRQSGGTGAPPPEPCHVMHPGARSGPAAGTGNGAVGKLPSAGPGRGSAPCLAATPPLEVTGARFGLSSQFVNGRPELVPSWLFSTIRSVPTAHGTGRTALTLAQPAVDPAFITRPSPPAPAPSPSAPGGTASSSPRVTSYSADGRTLSLRFWGGLCSSYSAKVLGQSGDAVHVEVAGVAKDPRQKCPMLAKSITVKTTLDQPLGSRRVVDSTDGHAVAAQK